MTQRYRCTVWEKDGRKTVIERSALNEEELIRSFASGAQTLISYKEIKSSHKNSGHVSKTTILSFTENISALLQSGLSVQESISVCARIADKTAVSRMCNNISLSLSEGKPLHESLAMHGVFPSLYIPLVRIGELTGSVPQVFARLSVYLNTKKELFRKLTAALVYPITVCVTALLVVLCMILFVFPKFSAVFEVFSAESPELAKRMESISLSVSVLATVCIFLASIVFVCVILRKLSEQFAKKIDRLLLTVPLVSKYIKTTETNDFSFAMELLCSSGVGLVSALEQSALVARNKAFKEAVLSVAEDVRNGNDVSESMKKHKEFPAYIVTWLGIGEATGSVQKSFAQIRSYYEKELSSIFSTLAAGAEPAFILAAGIIIFILVGQFVLPIFSMLGEL